VTRPAPELLEAPDLERVGEILQRACGVSLTRALQRALQDSFNRAANAQQLGPREFMGRLLSGDAESVASLVEHSVIGETYFFRHPEQFAALKRQRVPDCASDPALHVWAAACASGEEPYSIALTLAEAGRLRGQDRILATDVSERTLAHAREARYGSWSLRRIEPERQEKLFERVEGGLKVVERYVRQVEFRRHNLVTDPPPALGYHVVFCRNVLIYFSPETAARVLHKLHDALRPGGLLVIGPVEIPLAATLDLEWIDCEGATLLRKPRTGRLLQVPRPPAPRARPAPQPVRPRPLPVPVEAKARPAPEPVREPARELVPSSAGFLLAREAARKGQLDEAERLARDVATQEMLPEAYLLLSMAAESRGDLKGAVEAVRRALYLEPELAAGHATLVVLYQRLGRPEDSDQARRNALRVLEGMEEGAEIKGVEAMTAGALRRALQQAGERAPRT